MDFKIGDKLKVYTSNMGTARDGELIYKNKFFITIKFRNYPESFQYFELKTGHIRLEAAH